MTSHTARHRRPRETPAHPSAAEGDRHGSGAFSAPRSGWKDFSRRIREKIGQDNLGIVSAGVAFFGFLAVVPALATVIAIYGLVAEPSQIESHVQRLAQVAPSEVMPLLQAQLTRIGSNQGAAGLSAVVGLVFVFFGSLKGAKGLIAALNIAFDERGERGFIKKNLVAVALTCFGALMVILLLGLVAVLPAVLNFMGLPEDSRSLVNWIRWPLIAGFFMLGLTVLYRYGPDRERPKWTWVSWGAVLATVLWLAGSAAFSLYVSNFGNFDKTYGSLGAVVIFLIWLQLSAFVVLLGAEVNAEMERQMHVKAGEDNPSA